MSSDYVRKPEYPEEHTGIEPSPLQVRGHKANRYTTTTSISQSHGRDTQGHNVFYTLQSTGTGDSFSDSTPVFFGLITFLLYVYCSSYIIWKDPRDRKLIRIQNSTVRRYKAFYYRLLLQIGNKVGVPN